MPVESWITPEETPALAAAATAQIDAILSDLSAAERDAFWTSVRKCYNTPYNDPLPRKRPQPQPDEPAPVATLPPAESALDIQAA
ncbi:hypothetical protein [Methylobacterium nigriterrae]|uniref:hypothetical protein n=1 Tax=Methylobacterium nigriterrae TaxID=3127512 RepID=UPI003D67FE85